MKKAGVFVLMNAFLFQACGHSPAPVVERGVRPLTAPATYSVVKGDTLYSIAWRFGLDYQALAKANGISNGYTIFPGQILFLRSTRPAQRETVAKTGGQATRVSLSSKKTTKTPVRKGSDKKATSGIKWQWPTRGNVLARFSEENKGIDIEGKLGEPVHTAAAGKVVYAGRGLRGYGKLVIVKHDERYLSAYAHNRKLLVEEGATVRLGQQIAEMGSTGTRSVRLHFEIRREGKPVDPLQYLPSS